MIAIKAATLHEARARETCVEAKEYEWNGRLERCLFSDGNNDDAGKDERNGERRGRDRRGEKLVITNANHVT